jgi:hypothetical protein
MSQLCSAHMEICTENTLWGPGRSSLAPGHFAPVHSPGIFHPVCNRGLGCGHMSLTSCFVHNPEDSDVGNLTGFVSPAAVLEERGPQGAALAWPHVSCLSICAEVFPAAPMLVQGREALPW